MPPKRKIRNLPNTNDKGRMNQLSFFDPVYQNDGLQLNHAESDDELSVNSLSRQTYRDRTKDESNETLDAVPMTHSSLENEVNELYDQDQSSEISMTKIVNRIKQIQYSLQQAQQMLESMEKFKHLVPGTNEQSDKLRVIIDNLEEQKAGYVNLLNLITLTNEERSELIDRISATQRTNTDDQSNEDDDEDEITSRRPLQSPVRPRIESKIGFTPQPIIPATPTVPPTINSSDNEQNNRHDNSNYDSLVGSLKSDTLNWKDQQLTSDDEASEAESGKEIERNLMLQKEQLRALQGQKRALLAIKKRSEQRLVEQQQQLATKKPANPKVDTSETDLLSDINNLRDRLKLLRNLYDQKHQVEVQQIKKSSKKSSMPNENRLENLHHVREQLDELEKIVTYYQLDLIDPQDEETTVYEETPIPPDDAQRLRTLIIQQRQQASSSTINTIDQDEIPKPLDKLSNELAAKRLELEQAKSALSRLQQMVKTIEPDECSSSIRSTPVPTATGKSTQNNNNYESNANPKTSLLSSILSSNSTEPKKLMSTGNGYADAKMAAQHREIERLVESRQRLHTLKDQIANLHQSMTTPPIPSKKDSTNSSQVEVSKAKTSTNTYEINPRNIRVSYPIENPDDDDSELYRFECESGDGEEIDDESDEEIPPRIKQGNFRAPEDIVAEHEQRLLTKKSTSTDELSDQMRDICRCLTTFIQEQKSFNRHIEEHLTSTHPSQSPRSTATVSNDPVFNQLQQQVLTQGLIVNLNTAYREIAVLQSEINALQSENTRLASASNNHYQYRPQVYSRDNSKDSIYSLEQIKPIRPQTRSRYDEENPILTSNNKFENSSKTSFNSQSTGKQTAIHCEKNDLERTPIKHERNGTYSTTERLSSPKSVHLHSKENLAKSFVIRRRPMFNDTAPTMVQSQLFNYNQQNTSDIDDEEQEDDDDETADEQHMNDLSKTIFNIQPSAYYTSTTHDLDNVDVQALDLQIKSVMVQLIPFMRLHINDRFNQTILNHIRERIVFLFKQQPDSASLIRQFQNQFADALGNSFEKYCGTMIRDCANDLIRDISDVVFEELVKYKLYENTNQNAEINADEQISSMDDGENENKYQIELAESENRPLNLIGSDEEDNDSDQEENKDSELETAVSRQEINLNTNELPSSTELHSNGHEYVLVNRSISNENTAVENEQTKNENNETNES